MIVSPTRIAQHHFVHIRMLNAFVRSVARWRRRCWPTICCSWFTILKNWKIWAHDASIHTCIYKNCGERVVAYLSHERQTIGIIPIRFEIARRPRKKMNVCYTDIKSFLFILSLLSIQWSGHTIFIWMSTSRRQQNVRTNNASACTAKYAFVRNTPLSWEWRQKKKPKRKGEK